MSVWWSLANCTVSMSPLGPLVSISCHYQGLSFWYTYFLSMFVCVRRMCWCPQVRACVSVCVCVTYVLVPSGPSRSALIWRALSSPFPFVRQDLM